MPLGGHPLTGAYRGQGAGYGNQVAVSLGFDLEDTKVIFLVVERDPFDQPGKVVYW